MIDFCSKSFDELIIYACLIGIKLTTETLALEHNLALLRYDGRYLLHIIISIIELNMDDDININLTTYDFFVCKHFNMLPIHCQ